MNINEAVVTAANEVLAAYLAPELASKLTQEIMQRARPEIEAAVADMVGFEIGKAPVPKAKAANKRATHVAAASPPAKGKAKAGDGDDDPPNVPIVTIHTRAHEADTQP